MSDPRDDRATAERLRELLRRRDVPVFLREIDQLIAQAKTEDTARFWRMVRRWAECLSPLEKP